MKKKVIALIGAVVVLLSAFCVPAFAAEGDLVTIKLDTLENTISVSGDIAYFGNVTVAGMDISGVEHSYAFTDFTLKPFFGNFYFSCNELSSQAISVYKNKIIYNVFVPSDSATFARVFITYDPDSLIVYNEEVFKAIFPGVNGYTYEDITQARQEGYDEGYIAGQGSIDQSAIRQEGYDQGYVDGFGAGQESIDQEAIRQEGYNQGYGAGYADGEQSTDSYQSGFADGVGSIDQEEIRQEGYDSGYDVGFNDGAASIDQESIRQEGYDIGYDEGYLDGTEFYKDLFDSATINIFRNCSMDLMLLYWPSGLNSGSPYTVVIKNAPINYGEDNIVVFSDIADFAFNKVLLEYPEATYDKITVGSIMFKWSMFSESLGAFSFLLSDQICYTYHVHLYSPHIYGYVDGSYASFRGSSYSSNNQKFFKFSDIPEGFTVSAFSVDFGSSVNYSLENFSAFEISADINVVSDVYKDGYVNGYFDGENAEFAEVKKESYNEGYNFGFSAGKKEGLQISETGDWKNLMLAVTEAPINTFQSLFNFEILGLDMRLAFGSILAVCVLLIIVKKVIL